MKSPEEIKKAVKCCATEYSCRECPYDNGNWCVRSLMKDVLSHMEQLEERIELMILQMRGDCGTCKHKDEYGETCQACMFSLKPNRPCWEYEGLPEVTSHEKPV